MKKHNLLCFISTVNCPPPISKSSQRSLSVQSIYNWISKIEKDEDIFLHEKPLKRMPRNVQKKVVRGAREEPLKSSSRKLASKAGISKTSVTKILKEKGYKYSSVGSERLLTFREKVQRVNYSKEMVKSRGKLLNQTIFSDEINGYESQ
jgi:transposase